MYLYMDRIKKKSIGTATPLACRLRRFSNDLRLKNSCFVVILQLFLFLIPLLIIFSIFFPTFPLYLLLLFAHIEYRFNFNHIVVRIFFYLFFYFYLYFAYVITFFLQFLYYPSSLVLKMLTNRFVYYFWRLWLITWRWWFFNFIWTFAFSSW